MNSHDDVKVFMEACGQDETGFGSQSELYMELITEEFQELVEAFLAKDMVEIADACADLKWVIEGLEHTLNIPQQEVWDEVSYEGLEAQGWVQSDTDCWFLGELVLTAKGS